jgi:hypothetical protein
VRGDLASHPSQSVGVQEFNESLIRAVNVYLRLGGHSGWLEFMHSELPLPRELVELVLQYDHSFEAAPMPVTRCLELFQVKRFDDNIFWDLHPSPYSAPARGKVNQCPAQEIKSGESVSVCCNRCMSKSDLTAISPFCAAAALDIWLRTVDMSVPPFSTSLLHRLLQSANNE